MAYTIVRFGGDYTTGGEVALPIIRFPRGGVENEYPYILSGITLGIINNSGFGLVCPNSDGWNTGDDEALRGRWRRNNGDGPLAVRIDLPDGPGAYRVIVGSAAHSYQFSRWVIRDGVTGSVRLSYDWDAVTTGWGAEPTDLDQWVDHNGVVRSIGNNILSSTPATVNISTGALVFELGRTGSGFSSDVSFFAFEKIVAGPSVSVVSPTTGRANGTVVDITVDDSTGCTGAAIGGVPLTNFTIVNATTVRGTTNGAITGATSVTDASGTGTGPTFTVVPIADAARIIGNPPWHPAIGPTNGIPYNFDVEAYNIAANVRDTLYEDDLTISAETIAAPNTVITAGITTRNANLGVASFTGIVFDGVPSLFTGIPVVFRLGGATRVIVRSGGTTQFIARRAL